MAAMLDRVNEAQGRMWECKECHRLVPALETFAYHLVDHILYGWCETCFSHQNNDFKPGLARAG